MNIAIFNREGDLIEKGTNYNNVSHIVINCCGRAKTIFSRYGTVSYLTETLTFNNSLFVHCRGCRQTMLKKGETTFLDNLVKLGDIVAALKYLEENYRACFETKANGN